jgi:hypothetical protein
MQTMQSSMETTHITSAEWRWVIRLSILLVVLAFLPFLWVAVSAARGTDWQFMEILNNPIDGATYLSKMLQGFEGSWLITFRHTSEIHSPIFIQTIYPALGHLARILGIPPVVIFHVARGAAAFLMYFALYNLAATIWPKKQSRQLFFIVVTICSGLGWLYIAVTGGQDTFTPDLAIPEVWPFYSSLVNVHFPLTIACLALLASIYIVMFRPGCNTQPTLNNSGVSVAVLSLGLSILYPQALVPFAGAVGGSILFQWIRDRKIGIREIRWLLVLGLPALPMAAYYVAIIAYNPAVAEWNSQNVTSAPAVVPLVFGLGIPLLIALPAIVHAVRQSQQDGDRLMLFWLISIVILLYLPTNVQRRFMVAGMIPVAYFSVRALESFWFMRVSRRWRFRLQVFLLPAAVMTYVLLMLGNFTVNLGPFLPRTYNSAISWLQQNHLADQVVLSSTFVSVWIPGVVGSRVYYGHPYETLDAESKFEQLEAWYQGARPEECLSFLRDNNISYVVVGPLEMDMRTSGADGQLLTPGVECWQDLQEVFSDGPVSIYAP